MPAGVSTTDEDTKDGPRTFRRSMPVNVCRCAPTPVVAVRSRSLLSATWSRGLHRNGPPVNKGMLADVLSFSFWFFSMAPVFAAGWASARCYSRGTGAASTSETVAAGRRGVLDSHLVSWERIGSD